MRQPSGRPALQANAEESGFPKMIGTSLNQYRITATIGAGGMGEVFRARDTRLNRDVAVKVLPKDFVADADRLRRFEQAAKTLAALSHPNVPWTVIAMSAREASLPATSLDGMIAP
jgi:serine/threonine protein kinase